MKKIVKGALCAGLALSMCAAVGCGRQSLDPETRQLNLAVGALDGNFNPFTYTSANDGEMIGMTQLSLLTIDKDGKIIYGENEVCAALDMKVTTKDANGNVVEKGDNDGTTEYEITLKKGIMFSDGVHELTIKDVLFNLYVYLDPAYTGSTTIYSTDIRGLKAYRTQDPNADENGSLNIDSTLVGAVEGRIQDIVYWSQGETGSTEQIEADVALAKTLFQKEIESDWTSIYGGWEESYKAYNFTEAWQAYLFSEGLVQVQERNNVATNSTSPIFNDKNGNGKRDEGETYYTTLDPWQQGAIGASDNAIANGERGAQHFIDLINEATTDEEVNKYIAENEGAEKADAIVALQRKTCIERVFANYTSQEGIQNIVQYWATASNLYDEILGQLRTAEYDRIKEENGGKLLVENISGITSYKNANGNDVLKIVINGIDPKAEYNWAFPIAPLYYYSGVYKNKDYVAAADPSKNEFGLEFGNSDFFNTVISDTEKNGVPMGAGAYKASTRTGGDNPTKATFNANTSNCYFKRNDYFETVGENIENAKIKFVNYKVYSDSKIMQALENNEIDFGKPNATKNNVNFVSQNVSTLSSVDYETGGYGYIGVNPKAVPEYKVRQAIMKAIDTSIAVNDFYGSRLAEVIYRPMSKTSWAYPEGATEYSAISYDSSSDGTEIKALMEQAGYVRNGTGLYKKTYTRDGMANSSIGSTVKLTFTIAGESTEHPAYLMFTRAADRLNSLGFDITVTTDPNALKSLITGDLDVWAAAWTSASDPDMYQIFHKDSTATSVNNWNYKNILKGTDNTWGYEAGIIDDLSDKIDEARTYLERRDRTPIYSECLDLVMDLAVELPTYQRHDLCVYNKKVINSKSLVANPNSYIGLFDKIWEIEYV